MRWAKFDRLPALTGRALAIYRPVWWLLFAWALVSITVVNWQAEVRDQALARASYNLGLRPNGGDGIGQLVAPSSAESRRQGVVVGDRMLAVDGRAAEPEAVAFTRQIERADGKQAKVVLRAPNGQIHQATLTASSSYLTDAYAGSGLTFELRRWTGYWTFFVGSALALMVALILFLRRPGDPVSVLISAGALIGDCALAPLGISDGFFARVPGALSNSTLLLALLAFPTGELTPRWTYLGVVAIAGNFLFLLSPLSVTSVALLPLQFIVCFAFAVAAIAVRFRRAAPGIARQQIKYALVGVAFAALLIIPFQILTSAREATANEGIRAWLLLGAALNTALINIVLFGALLIALLRFRLYDAESVISRSAAYAFLTLLLGAAFAGSEKVIEVLGEEFFGEGSRAIAAGLGAAVAAMLVAPLHGSVHQWAERRFQKGLMRLRLQWPLRLADLRETETPAAIAGSTLEQIEAGARAVWGAVVVDGVLLAHRDIEETTVRDWLAAWQPPLAPGPLDCDDDDPVLPMRVALHGDGVGHIGWLLLGPRPDGSLYGRDERHALVAIADPVARALTVATKRQTVDQAHQHALSGLRTLIDDLIERLAKLEAGRPLKSSA